MTYAWQDAHRIAERAGEAWFGRMGHGELIPPLSMLAALALADRVDEKTLLSAPDAAVVRGAYEMWMMFWVRRPDLAGCWCGPLMEWFERDNSRETIAAAAAVARAAVRGGITRLVRRPVDVDVLGPALMTLRSKSALQGRGQMFSPRRPRPR